MAKKQTSENGGYNNSEYFSQGSLVRLKSCSGGVIEGRVLAFDPPTRMMILKSAAVSPSAHGSASERNDINFVNLSMMADVNVLEEAKDTKSADSPVPTLNIPRLNARAATNVERKRVNARAYNPDVPQEAQKLFRTIAKTIDEIDWNGKNINVMRGKVIISPPYKSGDLKGSGAAFNHIKKIVEKHYEDALNKSMSSMTTATPTTPLTPVSSSSSSEAPQQSSSPTSPSEQSKKKPAKQQKSSPSSKTGSGGGGGGGGSGPKSESSSSTKPMYFMQ